MVGEKYLGAVMFGQVRIPNGDTDAKVERPGKFNIGGFGGAAIGGYQQLPVRFLRVADIVNGRFQR